MYNCQHKYLLHTCCTANAFLNFYLESPCKSQPFLLHSVLLFDLKIGFGVTKSRQFFGSRHWVQMLSLTPHSYKLSVKPEQVNNMPLTFNLLKLI